MQAAPGQEQGGVDRRVGLAARGCFPQVRDEGEAPSLFGVEDEGCPRRLRVLVAEVALRAAGEAAEVERDAVDGEPLAREAPHVNVEAPTGCRAAAVVRVGGIGPLVRVQARADAAGRGEGPEGGELGRGRLGHGQLRGGGQAVGDSGLEEEPAARAGEVEGERYGSGGGGLQGSEVAVDEVDAVGWRGGAAVAALVEPGDRGGFFAGLAEGPDLQLDGGFVVFFVAEVDGDGCLFVRVVRLLSVRERYR